MIMALKMCSSPKDGAIYKYGTNGENILFFQNVSK